MDFQKAIEQIEKRLDGRVPQRLRMPNYRPAAIVIPLFEKGGDSHVLLTLRTDTVEHHKGQVSFPGGAYEDQDASIQVTAVRETEEEVGIPAGDINIIGQLDDFPTITDFLVSPFIGTIPYPYKQDPNPAEVAELLEVPLSLFLSDSDFEVKAHAYKGKEYPVYYYHYKKATVWGFTAFIMNAFVDMVFDYNPAPYRIIGDPRKEDYLKEAKNGSRT